MTALDDYGPFDSGVGGSRTEDFWRDFFAIITGAGVIDGQGNEFAVSERAAGANMSVDVATGECFIRGHWGESTSVKNMALSAAHATLARIDRIVLRADFSANTISVEVLEGTPHASPSVVALTQNSSRWEIALAQISVPATDTTIGSAQITDERSIIEFPQIVNDVLNLADQMLTRPILKDYGEEVHAHGNTSTTETIDIENGNVHSITLDANCTLTFSNPTASGDCCSFTLIVLQDATGSRTITWPASVKWAGGVAPTLTTTASRTDVFTFITTDGGTKWMGFVGGLNFNLT